MHSSMMKLSVVLFVVFVASVCANDADNAQTEEMAFLYEKCLEKVGMTMKKLKKFSGENKPNRKMDCLHACLLIEEFLLKDEPLVKKRDLEEIAEGIATQPNGKAKAEAFMKCLDFKKELTLCEAGRVVDECLKKIQREFGKE